MKEEFYKEVKAGNKMVRWIEKNYPELFDSVCDIVEDCQTTTKKYSNNFVTTCHHKVYGEIPAYDAARYPKNVMFAYYAIKLCK